MTADLSAPIVEALVPPPDPLDACESLAGLPYRLLLDSAAPATRGEQWSFLTADPVKVIRSRGGCTEIIDRRTAESRLVEGDALAVARAEMGPFAAVARQDGPPFAGGVAGYLAYEWGRTFERLPLPRADDLGLWDVTLGLYDWVIAWEHGRSRAWLVSTGIPEHRASARMTRAETRASAVRERLRSRRDPVSPNGARGHRAGPPPPTYPVNGWWSPDLRLRSTFTEQGYLDAVARIREYILAGDVFQVNLSQRFDAQLDSSPWQLYRRLRERSPAPLAAFIELPDVAILSASPERFLRVDPADRVETRPIKGTRPRGASVDEDAALARALVESAKDRAEHVMIVDLMRNDLSRVCSPGTVRVPELRALERHATVHHLVSTVVGTLECGADAADAIRAAFPGGSITGAPKIRAMEIIAELEPTCRGVYCGSIGYWSLSGALDLSIAIRTAVVKSGRVYFGAGGGVVADSDPEGEYRETLDKARGIIDALSAS